MQYPITVNNMASKFLLTLLLGVATLPVHAKMYKWVDAQGNVHYTDTLPPNAAAQGNAELSKTGNIVKKTESAEERSKRLAAEAEAAERKKVADEQVRKDRALLSTYTTEQEIDLSRDRALEHHNLAIKSAQSRLKQLEPGAKELVKKVEAASKGGKPVPAHMKQQYDAALAEVEETKRIIKTNEEALVAVRERYGAEKLRFQELSAKR
jgi:hypothetical protein